LDYLVAMPLLARNGMAAGPKARAQALKQLEAALDRGASPNQWQEGDAELGAPEVSPARAAVQANSTDFLLLLIKARADVNEKDSKRVSLLHTAAYSGQSELCRNLLEAEADPNTMDCHGQSPVFFAPNRATCEVLYKSHADMHILNLKGQSAVHLAARAGLSDVLLWFSGRVSRAVLCLRDGQGFMAVDYARRAKARPEAVQRLEQAVRGSRGAPGQSSGAGPRATRAEPAARGAGLNKESSSLQQQQQQKGGRQWLPEYYDLSQGTPRDPRSDSWQQDDMGSARRSMLSPSMLPPETQIQAISRARMTAALDEPSGGEDASDGDWIN
jgi:hypothetical protein